MIVAKAKAIVRVFEKAKENGLGVVALGSKMIDAQTISDALNGKRSDAGYLACCPAHGDRTPSLKISEGGNQAEEDLFKGFDFGN